jgi:hypothetical protein
MRILAARQPNQAARESDALHPGLLSYALTQLGLIEGEADCKPADGLPTAGEWHALHPGESNRRSFVPFTLLRVLRMTPWWMASWARWTDNPGVSRRGGTSEAIKPRNQFGRLRHDLKSCPDTVRCWFGEGGALPPHHANNGREGDPGLRANPGSQNRDPGQPGLFFPQAVGRAPSKGQIFRTLFSRGGPLLCRRGRRRARGTSWRRSARDATFLHGARFGRWWRAWRRRRVWFWGGGGR